MLGIVARYVVAAAIRRRGDGAARHTMPECSEPRRPGLSLAMFLRTRSDPYRFRARQVLNQSRCDKWPAAV
jgi:hypothetical protein